MKKIVLILFPITLLTVTCRKNEYKNLDCSTATSYTNDLKPILTANCTSSGCHGSGSGNGDFTTYTGFLAKIENKSVEKEVLDKKTMPPSGALSLDDRKKIKCWIDAGAQNN